MFDRICTKPFLDLLSAAMEKGAIKGWSVDGSNVVLYGCDEKYSALPLVAGEFLRDLLAIPHSPGQSPKLHLRITAE